MSESPFDAIVDAFLKEWNLAHPGAEPMGWKLRETSIPWVRFHALPGSKRYAESDSERATILSRANMLGTKLLGDGNPCWVVEARADDIDGQGDFIGSYREEPDAPLWRYHVRAEEWLNGKFDSEIAAIADDGPAYMLWICRESSAIFAPYDGGFDLFPNSQERMLLLRAAHKDWLSDREDGL